MDSQMNGWTPGWINVRVCEVIRHKIYSCKLGHKLRLELELEGTWWDWMLSLQRWSFTCHVPWFRKNHADLFDLLFLWDCFRLLLWDCLWDWLCETFIFPPIISAPCQTKLSAAGAPESQAAFKWMRWGKSCTPRVDQMSWRNIQFCLLRKFHS